MPEEVLFKFEGDQTRDSIAAYLRNVAQNLEDGNPISLTAGDQSVTLDPPARPTFEVKAEREGPTDGSGEVSVEFELEWNEGADGDDGDGSQLEIE